MRAFRKLLKNELRLSIRDMNMAVFAIIMPVVDTLNYLWYKTGSC